MGLRTIGSTIGADIRRERESHGWTQEDLAHEAGYTTALIGRLERSSSIREFRVTTIDNVLQALDMDWIVVVQRPTPWTKKEAKKKLAETIKES